MQFGNKLWHRGLCVSSLSMIVCLSFAQVAPVPTIAVPNSAATKVTNASGQMVGNSAIDASKSIGQGGSTNSDKGTLKRIEILMREQAENEIRAKAMKSALPGFPDSMPVTPSIPPLPVVGGPLSLPVMNGVKVATPKQVTSTPASNLPSTSALESYYTSNIIVFDGSATAEIVHNDQLSMIRQGDVIQGWNVARISGDGVELEKIFKSTPVAPLMKKVVKSKSKNKEIPISEPEVIVPQTNIFHYKLKSINDKPKEKELAGDNMTNSKLLPGFLPAIPTGRASDSTGIQSALPAVMTTK